MLNQINAAIEADQAQDDAEVMAQTGSSAALAKLAQMQLSGEFLGELASVLAQTGYEDTDEIDYELVLAQLGSSQYSAADLEDMVSSLGQLDNEELDELNQLLNAGAEALQLAQDSNVSYTH